MKHWIRQALAAAAALLALAGPILPAAAAEQEILRPEAAFRYTVSVDGQDVRVDWTIAPGHYLYQERMSFESRTPGIVLGPAVMPAGKPYTDEYFGDMHVYRDTASIRIPVSSRPAKDAVLELAIRSQGCADVGLCYPPQTWMATVVLATDPVRGAAGGGVDGGTGGEAGSLAARLADPGRDGAAGAGADEPLPVEQAFRWRATATDPFTLEITWDIEPGYYLYRHTLKATSTGDAVRFGPASLPPGSPKFDEEYGNTLVFYNQAVMTLPLTRRGPESLTLPFELEFQGCRENSLCYPPQRVATNIDLPMAEAGAGGTGPADLPASEQDRLFELIRDGNLLAVMAMFAGLGLLLSFTPCCLPMFPILSGIIVGQGGHGADPGGHAGRPATSKAFLLSLAFVLGMAVTYTVLGAVFAAAGAQVQAVMQKPAVIIGVALLFVALALSMFGLFDLQIPSSWQTKLNALSGRQRSGSLVGAGIMGVISAAVVTTCVTPPLVAALTVIAKTGDIARGALALFALGIGMGIPLLAIGASAGRLIPRAGPWMVSVKAAFGLMMLAMAVWMLDRLWPGTLTLALWAVLLVLGGVLLGAFAALDGQAPLSRKLGKGFGIVAVLYGAALLIGALAGNEDPLRPLRFAAVGVEAGSSAEHETPFTRIKTVADLERELARAGAEGRPLMLDFYADWCTSCKEMEKYTFPDPAVRDALANAVMLQADVTQVDAEDQALMQRFGIIGPPTILFFRPDGTELDARRIVGFKPADEFAAHLRAVFAPPVRA